MNFGAPNGREACGREFVSGEAGESGVDEAEFFVGKVFLRNLLFRGPPRADSATVRHLVNFEYSPVTWAGAAGGSTRRASRADRVFAANGGGRLRNSQTSTAVPIARAAGGDGHCPSVC